MTAPGSTGWERAVQQIERGDADDRPDDVWRDLARRRGYAIRLLGWLLRDVASDKAIDVALERAHAFYVDHAVAETGYGGTSAAAIVEGIDHALGEGDSPSSGRGPASDEAF